jgi:hypothetical protein
MFKSIKSIVSPTPSTVTQMRNKLFIHTEKDLIIAQVELENAMATRDLLERRLKRLASEINDEF